MSNSGVPIRNDESRVLPIPLSGRTTGPMPAPCAYLPVGSPETEKQASQSGALRAENRMCPARICICGYVQLSAFSGQTSLKRSGAVKPPHF